MPTKKELEKELELLENTLKTSKPNPKNINYGPDERNRRRQEALKKKVTICLDQDIVQRFKDLNQGERGYQSLINRALREWLTVSDVKELLRTELMDIADKMEQARESFQDSHPKKKAS